MRFRKDINGLRAIAVIAVVLFHFNSEWLPGGFAGVDVFFVISGYLMTKIIFEGVKNETFSILTFYFSRAKRIIPALAICCLVLMLLGWLFLSVIDYKVLSKHVFSSITFFSNIVYATEQGYFDSSSHEKWLLHTWSLSVEWQFYLLFPIFVLFLVKLMSYRNARLILLITTAFSFFISVIATDIWPSYSYFLLPTRAWEMLVGGIAYLYPLKLNFKNSKICELTGLLFIVLSYFVFNENTLWPGYLAFLPVLGCYLVIQANVSGSFLTSNFVFQKIGGWSYSIYLWHWPIVVFIGFYNYELSILNISLGLLLSIFLGFLSATYIEKAKLSILFPINLTIIASLLASIVYFNDGVISRFHGEQKRNNLAAQRAINDNDYPEPNLKVGPNNVRYIKGTTEKNILFIGASHIEHTYPYVSNYGSEYNIYYLTKGGCSVLPSDKKMKWDCSNVKDYKKLIETVNFDKIVTSFYFFHFRLPISVNERSAQIYTRIKEYDEFLSYIKENSKEVYLILGEPRGKEFSPKYSVRENLNDSITVDYARSFYNTHNFALKKLTELDDVNIIDPIEYLCDTHCRTNNGDDFYYMDKTHMRPWYARKALGYLSSILDPSE